MSLRIIFYIFFALITNGCLEQRSESDKISDKIISQFVKKMKKKGLHAAGVGGGCTRDHKINLVDVTFDYHGLMDISHARVMIVDCTNELLEIINSNPKNVKYFVEFPVKVNLISTAIIGLSPDLQNNNYIKIVDNLNGNILYGTEHKKPFLIIHEETFEEAQKIVSQEN